MNFSFEPSTSNDPLNDFGTNLTAAAMNNKLSPIIGRDDEIRRIIRILSRKTKNNPILIGEPGVGKTAIIEGLAQRIVQGQVPDNLKNKEIYEIDLPSIIAGASFQGQFEKRLKNLMKAIKDSNGKIIIFIDEVHTLIGTGKNMQGGMDAAQIIKPMLARGELHLIGATTLVEHKKYIESDSALERRMQKIIIDEPTETESITILRGIKSSLENYHHVKIKDSAIIAAVKFSNRYISDRYLPDKAIDLIDEAASGIKTEINSKPEALEKEIEKIAILSMEKAAIAGEKGIKTTSRFREITELLEKHEKKKEELTKKWENERKLVQNLSKYKEKIDELKAIQTQYVSDGQYEKASKILYQEIPNIEKKLLEESQKLKEAGNQLIKDNVTEDEIADIISKWTHIPVSKLLKSQRKRILDIDNELSKNVKGQSTAIKKVYNAILRSKADINDPNRPIGSFIFMGPTGVGKTLVAKTLADCLFNSEKQMIRIDMSEYMEKHSVSRLIGSPPGYIGYSEGGQLTEAVRRKPYSIILLDEIEKAHVDVLNILLQILDDGRLTDNQGRVVNFKNTIIIMTTNLGQFKNEKGDDSINARKELLKYLRPEFINRIDDIIIFNSLSKNVINEISKLELDKLRRRLLEKNIFVNFDDSVTKGITNNAYSEIFGARPIKNYIKQNIETELARKIIEEKIKENNHYNISLFGNKLIFKEKNLN